jgi:hypothetical protein
MIRAGRLRAAISALLTVGLVGIGFGLRSVDPSVANPTMLVANRRALAEHVVRADERLAALEAALAPALDDGRRGSARVVAGDRSPGPPLTDAAAQVEAAAGGSAELDQALEAVAGSTVVPGGHDLDPPTDAAQLSSIAAQLEAAGSAGEAFAAMRHRAEETVALIDRALAAVTAGEPEAALEHIGEARRAHEVLAAWESGLVTLPIWLGTIGDLIDVTEALATASAAGDADAAGTAAERFDELSGEAREADVALGVAIAEGGSAVAAAPMRRLATVLDRIARLRATLASILHETAAPAR